MEDHRNPFTDPYWNSTQKKFIGGYMFLGAGLGIAKGLIHCYIDHNHYSNLAATGMSISTGVLGTIVGYWQGLIFAGTHKFVSEYIPLLYDIKDREEDRRLMGLHSQREPHPLEERI